MYNMPLLSSNATSMGRENSAALPFASRNPALDPAIVLTSFLETAWESSSNWRLAVGKVLVFMLAPGRSDSDITPKQRIASNKKRHISTKRKKQVPEPFLTGRIVGYSSNRCRDSKKFDKRLACAQDFFAKKRVRLRASVCIFHSPWRFRCRPVPESISLLHSYLFM